MGVVSCGIGGLVVAHVCRRLLFGRSSRQCVILRHNGNCYKIVTDSKIHELFFPPHFFEVYYESPLSVVKICDFITQLSKVSRC